VATSKEFESDQSVSRSIISIIIIIICLLERAIRSTIAPASSAEDIHAQTDTRYGKKVAHTASIVLSEPRFAILVRELRYYSRTVSNNYVFQKAMRDDQTIQNTKHNLVKKFGLVTFTFVKLLPWYTTTTVDTNIFQRATARLPRKDKFKVLLVQWPRAAVAARVNEHPNQVYYEWPNQSPLSRTTSCDWK